MLPEGACSHRCSPTLPWRPTERRLLREFVRPKSSFSPCSTLGLNMIKRLLTKDFWKNNGLHWYTLITYIYFRPLKNYFIPIEMDAPAAPRNVPSKSTWKEMIHLPGAKKNAEGHGLTDFRIKKILVILYNIDISMWYLSNWYIYIYTQMYIYIL